MIQKAAVDLPVLRAQRSMTAWSMAAWSMTGNLPRLTKATLMASNCDTLIV